MLPAVSQPCPGQKGQSSPTPAPLYTSNPCTCSRAGPDHPLVTAHLLPLLNHGTSPLGRRYKERGTWGVWEEMGAESQGRVQAGRANMVLGVSNEV